LAVRLLAVYKWGSSVSINSTVTLTGGADDTYIFQISGDLVQAANTEVSKDPTLPSSNIFWQVAGAVEVGANSHFEGIILCSSAINLKTAASVTGRLLCQTEATLQKNQISVP
jgi:hypothetical protein